MKMLAILTLFAVAVAAPSVAASPVVINAFGDSLSAGYGLPAKDGFAPVLQQRLSARGYFVSVVNAAIAGETTSDALARADWMLENNPDIVILQFGANDMLRAAPPPLIYQNLARLVQKIQRRGARVLLAGMLAPANLGKTYQENFNDIYPRLEKEYRVLRYPFFLRQVAQNPALNLPDGLHPNAAGVRVMVDNIVPFVEQLLSATTK